MGASGTSRFGLTAAEVLRACGANMDELRKNLTQHIAEQTPRIAADREVDTQPTLGFQRVIQRAILHVQSSGKKEVTGANVLDAIFGEKDSHAVYFLHQKSVTRLDVVNYISYGISKVPQAQQAKTEIESETEHEAHLYIGTRVRVYRHDEREDIGSAGPDRASSGVRLEAQLGNARENALPSLF